MRNVNERQVYTPRRPDRIEVSGEHVRARWIAVILLIALALGGFGLGLRRLLSRDGGWTEIEARKGSPGCAAEFRLLYELDGKNAAAEYRTISALYTAACERAALVYSEEEAEGVGNLCTVNRRPNEAVTVEPELYAALAEIAASGERSFYLAPLYDFYSGFFFSADAEEAAAYDPLADAELADFFAAWAALAADPAQLELELLGDNRVRLRVSEELLRFAEVNGVERYVSLSWMKNAFILDDLSEAMRAQGFTRAALQSVDGFAADLGGSGECFSMELYDLGPSGVRRAAVLERPGPLCCVSLRSYSLRSAYGDWYAESEDGARRSLYLDPGTGLPLPEQRELLLWSSDRRCAELLLRGCPVFLSGEDPAALRDPDIRFARCDGGVLFCSDPEVTVTAPDPAYTLRLPS